MEKGAMATVAGISSTDDIGLQSSLEEDFGP
jgi:hypothetical protein